MLLEIKLEVKIMTMVEEANYFYTHFPPFFIGFVLGCIALSIIFKILRNKKVVRFLCKSLMVLPALLVLVILQLTGYYK
jgi:hypothetical protein